MSDRSRRRSRSCLTTDRRVRLRRPAAGSVLAVRYWRLLRSVGGCKYVKAGSSPRNASRCRTYAHLGVNELQGSRCWSLVQVVSLHRSREVSAGRRGCCTYRLYGVTQCARHHAGPSPAGRRTRRRRLPARHRPRRPYRAGQPARQPRLARLAAALTRPSRTPASRCPARARRPARISPVTGQEPPISRSKAGTAPDGRTGRPA
jgi:hypothetical protein